MAWRLAKSLEALRKQVNEAAPNRSTASDGTIGDQAHKARKSDHNPDKHGIVRALDLTHDPRNGVDGHRLAEAIVASRDPRVKYVIWNRRIASGSKGPDAWKWRPYSGTNPHDKHVHVSVLGGDPGGVGDRGGSWAIGPTVPDDGALEPAYRPILRRGDRGIDVKILQELLIEWGAQIKSDSDFGPRTEAAVRAFQKASGLVADGIVGAYTWRALLAGKEQV